MLRILHTVVALFGNPRVKVCSRLTAAYRSLPRPSSYIPPRHPPRALNNFNPKLHISDLVTTKTLVFALPKIRKNLG